MQDRRGGGEARLITGQCPFLQPGNDSGPANATCAAPSRRHCQMEKRRGGEALRLNCHEDAGGCELG